MRPESARKPDGYGSTVHSAVLVIGSGAAGLNAAVQLHSRGIEDVVVITESLDAGTSINTGSDKQTYYKIGMNGSAGDSPRTMASHYLNGGSMHGDLALTEAAVSGRAFLNLVNLGVAFPTDAYGQFIGYRTDHDAVGRGSSVGPYTSRDMCRSLIAEVRRRNIRVDEGRNVVRLVTVAEGDGTRAAGALALDDDGGLVSYSADHVVFAVGGPGGMYATSVYPAVHVGTIGLALEAGARARGLPECQYGLASTKFRWNVSGTYMQVIPRFVSTDADQVEEPREFLLDYFDAPETAHSLVFLKGYQWPFDVAKLPAGSSLIDILVYVETVERGRRVFLDFRSDPEGFDVTRLDAEARDYLFQSGARQARPIDRLRHMNPGAVELYADHNIDIADELLEVAVCAQHNNGGLAGDAWWRSENLRCFYPVGEVSGTHGVSRPGGSALNSGQVGGFRIAEIIRNSPNIPRLDEATAAEAFAGAAGEVRGYLEGCAGSARSWTEDREDIQARMTRYGAHIRTPDGLEQAASEARRLWERLKDEGGRVATPRDAVQVFRNRQLCLAHLVYLEAMRFQVRSGVGSRGSAMVGSAGGHRVHSKLDGDRWAFAGEDRRFRELVLNTVWDGSAVLCEWTDARPIPETDEWFETAWARYRAGEIYS